MKATLMPSAAGDLAGSIAMPRLQPIDFRCLSGAQIQAAAAVFRSGSDLTYDDIVDMLDQLLLSSPGPNFDIKKVLTLVGVTQPSELTCDAFLHLVAALWSSLERLSTHDAYVRHAYEAVQQERVRQEERLMDMDSIHASSPLSVTAAQSVNFDAPMSVVFSNSMYSTGGAASNRPLSEQGGGGGSSTMLPRASFIAPHDDFADDAVTAIIAANSSRSYRGFQSFMAPPEADAKLLAAFKNLGATDTGVGYYVDGDVFVSKCRSFGFSAAAARQIFVFFDDDSSGEIDFEEFRRILNLDLSSLGVPSVVLEGLRRIIGSIDRRSAASSIMAPKNGASLSGFAGSIAVHGDSDIFDNHGAGDDDAHETSGTVTLLDRLNQKHGEDGADTNGVNTAPLPMLERIEQQIEKCSLLVENELRSHEDAAYRLGRRASAKSGGGSDSSPDASQISSRRQSTTLPLIPIPTPPQTPRGYQYMYGHPPPPSRLGRKLLADAEHKRRPLHQLTEVTQRLMLTPRQRAPAGIGLPPISTTPSSSPRRQIEGGDQNDDGRRGGNAMQPLQLTKGGDDEYLPITELLSRTLASASGGMSSRNAMLIPETPGSSPRQQQSGMGASSTYSPRPPLDESGAALLPHELPVGITASIESARKNELSDIEKRTRLGRVAKPGQLGKNVLAHQRHAIHVYSIGI